ncbi:hypothetical protein CDO52_10095 [Nocardiopsis gilva YIM 90087]|uniref:Uncharacterized protein n=1 Tax=Nocardiopsis gilva YIM 90087 TaxID=1235441 RepID=A0A223S4M6_9ACTN|nr:DUF6315 family protein [Nocardiopsis gilva]ASU83082.1 hypothetical protein CDO52_10095 [Nocardiopsis gilva YIM 90087]
MKRDLTALCCDCGAIRQVSAHNGIGEAQSAYGHARCVVRRVCRSCGYRTDHAYLRDDADRDELEDALKLDDALAAEALDEEVEQLRLCGIDIGHAPVPAIWDGQPVGMVTQRLSDRSYAIVLDPESSVVARLKLIDMIWNELSIGDNEDRWYIQPAEDDSPGYAVRLFGYRVRR